MKQINALIAWIKRKRAIYILQQQLEFYPVLTQDNANEFSFEAINEILDIQHELKTI